MDVSKSREAAEDLTRKTGQMGVPVILVDGTPIIGFDRSRLEESLKG